MSEDVTPRLRQLIAKWWHSNQMNERRCASELEAILLSAGGSAPRVESRTDVSVKYQELLYAVETKHPGETRHETALRYIRQAETPRDTKACSVAPSSREEPSR